jgi:phosphatidate cytidylyltransferase
VLAAVALAPLLLGAAYVGGWVFLGAVCLLASAAAWEYCRMALPGRPGPLALVLAVGLAAALGRFLLAGAGPAAETWAAALATGALFGALVLGLAAPDPAQGLRVASLTLLGALYAGWLFSYLVGLRELPRALPGTAYRDGFTLVLAPLLLTWTSDIGAYFAGRRWGRRKLLPRVSPGKTLAGAAGGAGVAAVLAALLFTWAPGALPPVGAAGGFAIGLAASGLAQTGDLAESLLKRASGVKDSSTLIPGHGGVLDRFDALLFAAPAAFYYFRAVLS